MAEVLFFTQVAHWLNNEPVGMAISTSNLGPMMSPGPLRRLLQSLAALDAILCVEDDLRYHSFNANWGQGQQMASMANGAGDHYFVLFERQGCFFKGFDHECQMTPYSNEPPQVFEGVLSDVPEIYSHCLLEPAFDTESTTFCFWWDPAEANWKHGPVEWDPEEPDPDGSLALLSLLDGKAETYRAFAADYFEVEIDLADIEQVFSHRVLTEELVRRLNPERNLAALASQLLEIGYPE